MRKYKAGDKFEIEIREVYGSEMFPYGMTYGGDVAEEFLDKLPRINAVDESATRDEHFKGMEDAFQLMKRIANMSMKEFDDIFGGDILFGDLFKFDTIKKVMDKVLAYENRLKVGDILQKEGNVCIVTAVTENVVNLLWADGKSTVRTLNDVEDYYERTGKDVPIKTLLESLPVMVKTKRKMADCRVAND